MSDELKPCPFCGGEAFMQAQNMHHKTCTVCKNCGISTAWGTPEEVIAAWNRRAPSAHIVDTNKKVDDNQPQEVRHE